MKKTIIFLTVTIIILVLSLPCFAATETIYIPPLAAYTLDTRYSISGNNYVNAVGSRDAITIPLPIDKSLSVTIDLNESLYITSEIGYLDADYKVVHREELANGRHQIITLNPNYTIDSVFLVINVVPEPAWSCNLSINGTNVAVNEGPYTIAHLERYEQVEVPDPPVEVDIVNNVLEMWQRILADNLILINQFYDSILAPIALILGVPTIIALVGIIYHSFGGKK